MEAVTLAGWPTFQVHPLDMNEKAEIVTGYMDLYGKTLNDEQRALIINAKQTNNPLYLKALLDEVGFDTFCVIDYGNKRLATSKTGSVPCDKGPS